MSLSRKRRSSGPQHPEFLVEVVDTADKPLLIMPLQYVVRQKLCYRSVLVCLRNMRGEIFLHKRSFLLRGYENAWHIAASGFVPANISRYDAARNALEQHLGIRGLEIAEAAYIPPCPATGNTAATLYLTSRTSAMPIIQDAREGFFVDRDEFKAFLRDFPHLVAPYLHLLAEYIFPSVKEGGQADPGGTKAPASRRIKPHRRP